MGDGLLQGGEWHSSSSCHEESIGDRSDTWRGIVEFRTVRRMSAGEPIAEIRLRFDDSALGDLMGLVVEARLTHFPLQRAAIDDCRRAPPRDAGASRGALFVDQIEIGPGENIDQIARRPDGPHR